MSLEPLSIRRPTADQFSEVVALLTQSQLGSADISLANLQHFRLFSTTARVLAVGGLEPLGRIALLRSVAVVADQQGQGLATQLVQALETHARRIGLHALYLLSARAGLFFARQGFSEIARNDMPAALHASAELTGSEHHGVVMVKILRAPANDQPSA
jgi:amino-acid N-acetyltransferase